ncbi:MAG: hypothetical protein WGN25_12670 [Candidatus Electrothrix sp. GW3-4]|uniref:hypothetical protein n=1 Tax=Candidatus Electrothrix sp. GW3-4 TaxID=3126740 RepID=UPI0030D0A257
MNIPKEEDWGEWKSDLDKSSAHERFAGRKFDDFLDEYRDNSIEMADELRFMPAVPFQYYIFSFAHYIQSDLSENDADGASCYLLLIEEKLKNEPETILSVIGELISSVRYVASNQSYYDADIDIYGDFRKKYRNIIELEKMHHKSAAR